MTTLLGTFTLPLQGIVPASGRLDVNAGPGPNEQWEVTQISLNMPTIPSGCTAEIRHKGTLYAPAFSAKKAAIGGPPPLLLHGAETVTVRWDNATPGQIAFVHITYNKYSYI
jgi:hypothetical protein